MVNLFNVSSVPIRIGNGSLLFRVTKQRGVSGIPIWIGNTKDVVPVLLKEIADMMAIGEDKFYLSLAGKMQIKEGDNNR